MLLPGRPPVSLVGSEPLSINRSVPSTFLPSYILPLLHTMHKIEGAPCEEAGLRLPPASDRLQQLHFQTSPTPLDQQNSSSCVEILHEDGHCQIFGVSCKPVFQGGGRTCKLGSWMGSVLSAHQPKSGMISHRGKGIKHHQRPVCMLLVQTFCPSLSLSGEVYRSEGRHRLWARVASPCTSPRS